MAGTQTIDASEFKAKCLDILDRLASRELARAAIIKQGRVVAVLSPPEDQAAAVCAERGD